MGQRHVKLERIQAAVEGLEPVRVILRCPRGHALGPFYANRGPGHPRLLPAVRLTSGGWTFTRGLVGWHRREGMLGFLFTFGCRRCGWRASVDEEALVRRLEASGWTEIRFA